MWQTSPVKRNRPNNVYGTYEIGKLKAEDDDFESVSKIKNRDSTSISGNKSSIDQETDEIIFYGNNVMVEDDEQTNESPSSIQNEDTILKLFDTGFSFTKSELLKLIDGYNTTTTPNSSNYYFSQKGNQNALIQELKTALKTVVEECEQIKVKCCEVERTYKHLTAQAAFDLKQSMNILFKLQQQTQLLEQANASKDKLSFEKLKMRERAAMKDREKRMIEQELVEKTKELEQSQMEVERLKELLSLSARHAVVARMNNPRASAVSLQSRDSVRNLTKLRETLATDENPFQSDLMDAISYIEELRNELEILVDENSRLKSELELQALQQPSEPVVSSEERLQRQRAEQLLDQERVKRITAEERLSVANMEWDVVSEQVEAEMAAKDKKIVDLTGTIERYVAMNKDLAERLDTLMAGGTIEDSSARPKSGSFARSAASTAGSEAKSGSEPGTPPDSTSGLRDGGDEKAEELEDQMFADVSETYSKMKQKVRYSKAKGRFI